MLTRLFFYLSFFLFSLALSAQITSLEAFFGGGTTEVANSVSTFPSFGQVTVGFGESYRLVQNATSTYRSETIVTANGSAMAGLEAFFALGDKSSIYAGLKLGVSFYRYEQFSSSFAQDFTGPIDTIFNQVIDPGNGGGSIDFCSNGNFLLERDIATRGFMLDAGLPIGYRRTFFNGVLAARIQGWLGTPLMVRFTRLASSLEQTEQGCFVLITERERIRSGIDVNSFLFRAGVGLDLALGHSVKVGLLVEQQLNDTYTTGGRNSFSAVPETKKFRPLFGSLVARYQLR